MFCKRRTFGFKPVHTTIFYILSSEIASLDFLLYPPESKTSATIACLQAPDQESHLDAYFLHVLSSFAL